MRSNPNRFAVQKTLLRDVIVNDAQLLDFGFPAHCHEHVVIGALSFGEKTSKYGFRRHEVRQGDVMLVNPGQTHDGVPAGRQGRRHTMLEIDIAAFERMCAFACGRADVEFERPIVRSPEIYRAFRMWRRALLADDAAMEQEAQIHFFGVLQEAGAFGPRGVKRVPELANRARLRILESLDAPDHFTDMACQFGVSRYQVLRAFRAAYGMTPEEFRRQQRVQRARDALGNGESLSEVAASAGFSDQSHMTREFRRLVGVTPGEYRYALQ